MYLAVKMAPSTFGVLKQIIALPLTSVIECTICEIVLYSIHSNDVTLMGPMAQQ